MPSSWYHVRAPRQWQRHHIFPLQLLTDIQVAPLLLTLASLGLHLHDFATNGLLLPGDEEEAVRTGRALHRGPHPRYTAFVKRHLLRMKEDPDDTSADELLDEARVLQRELREHLVVSQRPSALNLNDRDPFRIPSETFDARTDEIFAATIRRRLGDGA